MYRVLIADDDAIIRRGLKKTIDWESYGMERASCPSHATPTISIP